MRESLSEYSFTLSHISGVKNYVADFLSRHPVWDANTDPDIFDDVIDEPPQVRLLTHKNSDLCEKDPLLNDLKTAAAADVAYQEVIRVLLSGQSPLEQNADSASRHFREVWERLSVSSGLLKTRKLDNRPPTSL